MARPNFDPSDVKENRFKGGLGYLLILFFLPLILCPRSRYGRYCANQGLIALIVFVIISAAFGILNGVLGWIWLVGWAVRLVGDLAQVGIALIVLYYAYLACAKGDARELPVVGSYTLIK